MSPARCFYGALRPIKMKLINWPLTDGRTCTSCLHPTRPGEIDWKTASGKPQMMEALKLCQSAVSALQFQDADTAVRTLHQAITLLTTPHARPGMPGAPQ